MQSASQPVETEPLRFDLLQNEIRIHHRGAACAAAVEGATEKAAGRIVRAENLLHVGGGRMFQSSFQCPFALRQEAPRAIEFEPDFHVGGGLPAAHDGSREAKSVR